ncbi:multicopper oxidase domain-containing protein [Sedimentitalea xiamensis]
MRAGADNPGGWMLRCHLLGRAVAGTMTWFRGSA